MVSLLLSQNVDMVSTKKLSEMVTLCGDEVGVVIFSPFGKPYSFGYPFTKSMANGFLKQNPP